MMVIGVVLGGESFHIGLGPLLLLFLKQRFSYSILFFFVFVFLPFFGPLLQHMEVPRLGVESEL